MAMNPFKDLPISFNEACHSIWKRTAIGTKGRIWSQPFGKKYFSVKPHQNTLFSLSLSLSSKFLFGPKNQIKVSPFSICNQQPTSLPINFNGMSHILQIITQSNFL